MLFREDMHPYQNRAVEFIKTRRRVFLMIDLGLGKTVSTLTALVDLFDGFTADKALVIAPLRVANSVWKQECDKWEHLKDLRVSVCTGTERQRIAALHRSADVVVVNRENVPWLVKFYGSRWPFDTVVVDESTSFKNASSQRFKALRKVQSKTNYMVVLSGTPSPNGLLDLWAQAYLIDAGESLGRTMGAYKQRFFESDYMGYKYTPRTGSAEKIHELMQPYCLSMQAADYLELPPRIDIVEPVTLPTAVLTDYREFERELLIELDGGELLEAANAAVLAGKLLQWANGATYTDALGNWTPLHDGKIEALRELLEGAGEPALVAYNFKSDLARLQAAFPHAEVLDKNPETVARWNRGEIDLLLAHPASAGHGLNLQEGGALCIWFGLSWSLELYQQFNARLYRQGQTRPVRIVHLVAKGTIDERVMRVLEDKEAQQSGLLQALNV